MLSEISQRENTVRYHLHMISEKYNRLMNITKRGQLTDRENKLVLTTGERGKIGVGKWEAQISGCKLDSRMHNMENTVTIL